VKLVGGFNPIQIPQPTAHRSDKANKLSQGTTTVQSQIKAMTEHNRLPLNKRRYGVPGRNDDDIDPPEIYHILQNDLADFEEFLRLIVGRYLSN